MSFCKEFNAKTADYKVLRAPIHNAHAFQFFMTPTLSPVSAVICFWLQKLIRGEIQVLVASTQVGAAAVPVGNV